MTRKVPRKLFFVNIRLFLMEVLIIFVTIVFLMAKQAEFYGADLVKESDHYMDGICSIGGLQFLRRCL